MHPHLPILVEKELLPRSFTQATRPPSADPYFSVLPTLQIGWPLVLSGAGTPLALANAKLARSVAHITRGLNGVDQKNHAPSVVPRISDESSALARPSTERAWPQPQPPKPRLKALADPFHHT